MIDYSFLRFKRSFAEAKDIGDRAITEIFYHDYISLSPNETYAQITNVDGGISLDGGFTAEIIDCNENVLLDITNNIHTENITGVNGNNQLKIEIINIEQDFYKKKVFIRLNSNISDEKFTSNKLSITDYQNKETSYFQYKCYDNYKGIAYENANMFQSIRLKTYFDIPIDESEIESYFQISRNNTISARVLDKQFEQYKIDTINRFTYDRLNTVLKSDIVYIDGVRVTDKTAVESASMEGLSDFFTTDFTVSKNYDDTKEYEFQIYDKLRIIETAPQGAYTLAQISLVTSYAAFNHPIQLNTGTITLHDSNGVVIDSFTEADITTDVNEFNVLDMLDNIVANGTYYVNISAGLFSHLGIDYEGLTDTTTWLIQVQDADFLAADFNNNDFFTGI